MNKKELLYGLFKEKVIQSFPEWECWHKYFLKYYEDQSFLYELHQTLITANEIVDTEKNIRYHKQNNRLTIEYDGQSTECSVFDFMTMLTKFIGMMEYGYPVGTVVKLKKQYIKKMLDIENVGEVDIIIMQTWTPQVAVKRMLQFGGSVYPYGLNFSQNMIYFTEGLIESVVHLGYESEQSMAYELEMKRLYYIEADFTPLSLTNAADIEKTRELMKKQHVVS